MHSELTLCIDEAPLRKKFCSEILQLKDKAFLLDYTENGRLIFCIL